MSIIGLTIDYGPFGFLDRYDPNHICNGSDHGGRYTYKNQPEICKWNCLKLAEMLDPHVPLAKAKEIIANTYQKEFDEHYYNKMRLKLGLKSFADEDKQLVEELFETMEETRADFTNVFRKLSKLHVNANNTDKDLSDFLDVILAECCSLAELKSFVKPSMPLETISKLLDAAREQPAILVYFGISEDILRQQLTHHEKYDRIKDMSANEKRNRDAELWSKWLRAYLKRVYAQDQEWLKEERVRAMNATNPRFVLRNHMAQSAIERADEENFDEARMLLKILENPFSDEPLDKILVDFKSSPHFETIRKMGEEKFFESAPPPQKCTKVTCSS